MAQQKPTGQPTLRVVIEPPEVDWAAAEAKIEAAIQEGLRKFRDEIEQLWHQKANEQLNTTVNDYLRGLSITITRDGVEAEITGFLPVALEGGLPTFDMKPGLTARGGKVIIPINGGFRSVSAKSPSDSWWHPGLQARNIGEQVKKEAPKIAKKIFGELLRRVEV